jgi:predicted ABC-type ATPase
MTGLIEAVDRIIEVQSASNKPLGIILAGHNGSGKSTMWREHLSDRFQLPLVNADRMMLSILPEAEPGAHLVDWARRLRDEDKSWMQVAQKGVEAFVTLAMAGKVPFAIETVFSDWHVREDGSVRSKLEWIERLQREGYFVLLFFVGLTNSALSMARVTTRVQEGGHSVNFAKLGTRFPRTQTAIKAARSIADAALLVDNSLTPDRAFDACRVELGGEELFDVRNAGDVEPAILEWLDLVAPR